MLAGRLQREFGAAWRRIDRNNIRGSWLAQVPQLLAMLVAAQRVAASTADAFISDTLGRPSYREVIPDAFAHVASDGRPLVTLLEQPAAQALYSLRQGQSLAYSLAAGQATAQLIGHTQTADAGRVADLVATAAHPAARGYVRMIVGKTCARCLVLAGRRYDWKADFKRHPRCDCIAIPYSEAVPGAAPVDPAQAFKEMSAAEQERVFTKAGAEAIRQGADIGQVVNARRGMRSASVYGRNVLISTEGTTKRRRFGQKLDPRRPRLMPEEILREANGDRQEAIRLLSLHGYIK